MADAGPVARFRAARRDRERVVVEGFHALKHALRFGGEIEVALSPDPKRLEALAADHAPDLGGTLAAVVAPCPADVFVRLAPRAPETGVIAIARRPAPTAVAAGAGPVVLLDAPRHLGNVGAAIRVAAAADAAALVVLGAADPWHPTAVRGAAGLQFALPCLRLDALPDDAGPLVAFTSEGAPLDQVTWPPGAWLAFGSERRGLGPAVRAAAALAVAIPMRAGVSSLNLATAVAVALYAGRSAARADAG